MGQGSQVNYNKKRKLNKGGITTITKQGKKDEAYENIKPYIIYLLNPMIY